LPNTLSAQQFIAPEKETSVQQPVGPDFDLWAIPWGQHVVILDKVKDAEEALFYLHQTIENNWSRAILTLQIEQDLYNRQGKAITNFRQTLPEKQALMAGQILKDPYNFSFLTLEHQAQELNVERQLTKHITKFLLSPKQRSLRQGIAEHLLRYWLKRHSHTGGEMLQTQEAGFSELKVVRPMTMSLELPGELRIGLYGTVIYLHQRASPSDFYSPMLISVDIGKCKYILVSYF